MIAELRPLFLAEVQHKDSRRGPAPRQGAGQSGGGSQGVLQGLGTRVQAERWALLLIFTRHVGRR